MKKITFILSLLLASSITLAQNTVDSTASSTWLGFINATPDCQGGFGFFQPDVSQLVTVLDVPNNTITLKPQLTLYDANPGDCVWDNGAGTGGSIVEANTFVEPAGFTDQDLTFQGNVSSVTIDPAYTVVAFIKGLNPNDGFNDVVGVNVPLTSTGNFSITATAAQLSSTTTPGIIVQYGFAVTGRNLPGAQEVAAGNVVVTEFVLSSNDFITNEIRVSPNPSNNFWNIEGSNSVIDNVEVYDLLGKRVLNLSPNSQEVRIDASGLKTGIYLAKLTSEGATKTIKLVKN